MELPHDEQANGERLKEMVEQHQLNEVLQSAVNAAFNAGSNDPVAFMGQFLVERQDRVPTIEKICPQSIVASDGSSTIEVDVYCKVNGVVKMLSRCALPSISVFPGPAPAPRAEGEGETEDAELPVTNPPKSADELCEALRAALHSLVSEGLDARDLFQCDEKLLVAIGSCVDDAQLFKGATMAVSSALVDAGAALQSFVGPLPVQRFEHVASLLSSRADCDAFVMPAVMMPLFAGGALGPRGHISVVPLRDSWYESYTLGNKVYQNLQTVLIDNEMDTTTNYEGSFLPVAPSPPDPKAKAPPAAVSTIDESLALIASAMEAAGVTSEDIIIAISPSGPSHCTVTEELPEGAEEGCEDKEVVYTYSFGEERRTHETVQMFVDLIDKGVGVLLDPLHLDDKAGLKMLASALVEKQKDFVLGGDLMYDSSVDAVSEAAAAAVDADDGEIRPWASCIQINMCQTGSVSQTLAVGEVMIEKKGKVILQNCDPHVAVGLGVHYVRISPLIQKCVDQYNEFCRIEQHLQQLRSE